MHQTVSIERLLNNEMTVLRELHRVKSPPNILLAFGSFVDEINPSCLPDWSADAGVVNTKTAILVSQFHHLTLASLVSSRVVKRASDEAPRNPLFSRRELITVLVGMADALAALFEHLIVHQDVKAGRPGLEHASFHLLFPPYLTG